MLSIINKIIEGAPDLVVEILSPANDAKEMSYKKYIYETSGVKEYWIINTEQQTLIQYLLIDNELHRQKQLNITDTLHAAIIPNFSIALQTIFAE
jgi:Uma2 family endonuclease